MAVVRAARRPKAFSPRSCSSSGLGSSISATSARLSAPLGAGRLANLLPHGVAPGFEGASQPLRLLLEEVAALVEPLARAVLRLAGEFLRSARPLAAALRENLARFPPGARRPEDRGHRPHGRAEEEPAEVTRRVALVASHGTLLLCYAVVPRTRPRLCGWRR